MAGRATSRWGLLPFLPIVVLPVASGAGLTLADGTLAAGKGTLAACDSGSPTITQNVGTGGNATSVVSLDVAGIASACGGGTVKVSVSNGTDAAQEATRAIPAGGGTVNVTLSTAVPLKEFDLTKCAPAIASTATVKQATLRLSLSTAPASNRTYGIYRVTTPCPEAATICWTEAGLTWLSQPTAAPTSTSSLGPSSTSALQYYGWDVTADAAAMAAGSTANYSWRIADASEGNPTAVTALEHRAVTGAY